LLPSQGGVDYRVILSTEGSFAFDENGLRKIYAQLNIDTYYEINFMHLFKYDANFFVGLLPPEDKYKNWRQIIKWDKGKLYRCYLDNKTIHTEEYMYVHYWRRPLTWKVENPVSYDELILYPDVVTDRKVNLTYKFILRKGRKRYIVFYIKTLIKNRNKITLEKIVNNISAAIQTNRRKKTDNYK
jgi:hypothetical protein